MTSEEKRKLAIECGADDAIYWIIFNPEQLATYTAAVEANMRKKYSILDEYSSTQWWYEELGKVLCLTINEEVTADMKRSSAVARKLIQDIEKIRSI